MSTPVETPLGRGRRVLDSIIFLIDSMLPRRRFLRHLLGITGLQVYVEQ